MRAIEQSASYQITPRAALQLPYIQRLSLNWQVRFNKSSRSHNPILDVLHQTLRAAALYQFTIGTHNFPMANESNRFNTGDVVPETGIYRVAHLAHRLPHEVVIFAGDHFPRCAKCANGVVFELVHPVKDLFQHTVRRIYELPVIDEEEDASSF